MIRVLTIPGTVRPPQGIKRVISVCQGDAKYNKNDRYAFQHTVRMYVETRILVRMHALIRQLYRFP